MRGKRGAALLGLWKDVQLYEAGLIESEEQPPVDWQGLRRRLSPLRPAQARSILLGAGMVRHESRRLDVISTRRYSDKAEAKCGARMEQ